MAYSEKKRRRRSREGERDSRKYPPSALCPGKSAVAARFGLEGLFAGRRSLGA
jgi:hypothetical protein